MGGTLDNDRLLWCTAKRTDCEKDFQKGADAKKGTTGKERSITVFQKTPPIKEVGTGNRGLRSSRRQVNSIFRRPQKKPPHKTKEPKTQKNHPKEGSQEEGKRVNG